jgi:hypothetical protein
VVEEGGMVERDWIMVLLLEDHASWHSTPVFGRRASCWRGNCQWQSCGGRMTGAIDLQKATDNITQLVGMCTKQDFHKAGGSPVLQVYTSPMSPPSPLCPTA